MKIWLDTTLQNQHDLNVGCEKDCKTALVIDAYDDALQHMDHLHSEYLRKYLYAGTLQHTQTLYIQAYSDECTLACCPTGSGRIVLLDAEASALLQCFQRPTTLNDVMYCLDYLSTAQVEAATCYFYRYGLLRDVRDPMATVTPIETQAVLQLFPGYQEVSIGKKIYYDLGSINDLKVVLFQQPHMGSSGTAGSHMSVKGAINAVSPLYVIMVGIAFGINSDKQNIGDILVSRHIQDYDPQRVSLGPDNNRVFEPRGDRVMASPHLLDLFMAGQYSLPDVWSDKPPKIDFGLILSGSKLVDHLDYRDELRHFAPDAIGGEMEGIGLYHAASDRKVHWILVKAICDWADGNKHLEKNDRQQLAASNAAIFTRHVLQRGGFEHHRTKKQMKK